MIFKTEIPRAVFMVDFIAFILSVISRHFLAMFTYDDLPLQFFENYNLTV